MENKENRKGLNKDQKEKTYNTKHELFYISPKIINRRDFLIGSLGFGLWSYAKIKGLASLAPKEPELSLEQKVMNAFKAAVTVVSVTGRKTTWAAGRLTRAYAFANALENATIQNEIDQVFRYYEPSGGDMASIVAEAFAVSGRDDLIHDAYEKAVRVTKHLSIKMTLFGRSDTFFS